MSRFHWASLGAAVTLGAVGAGLDGATRTWAAAGVGILYVSLVVIGVTAIRLRFFGDAVCRGAPGRHRVALTFDDGPDPAVTPALLDFLRRERIPAEFFCVGDRVRRFPEIVKRASEEGHGVSNHTMHHAWWTNFLVGRRLCEELGSASAAIGDAAGAAPKYYRSPAGLTNAHLPNALRQTGLVLVGWDVRSLDTLDRPAEWVVGRVLRKMRDGSIVVLHDGGSRQERLLEIVGGIVAGLRSRGYAFARLDELLERGPAPRTECASTEEG